MNYTIIKGKKWVRPAQLSFIVYGESSRLHVSTLHYTIPVHTTVFLKMNPQVTVHTFHFCNL